MIKKTKKQQTRQQKTANKTANKTVISSASSSSGHAFKVASRLDTPNRPALPRSHDFARGLLKRTRCISALLCFLLFSATAPLAPPPSQKAAAESATARVFLP